MYTIGGSMTQKNLGLFLLIALGISSMIGGGIFNSPTDLILKANPLTTLLAWGIGGVGVLCLVIVFQDLAIKKPELKGGIYSYAREGFGGFVGYFCAWGYWIGGLLGIVSFFPLFFKTLNSLLPAGSGVTPIWAFIYGSAALWIITILITMGVRDAGIANAIVTTIKLIPLALVILLGFAVFKADIFLVPNWGTTLASTGDSVSTFGQIKNAMGTILWCFLGVEAAVVLSGRAISQRIVGKATVIAFLITLAIYVAVSTLAMGVIDAKSLGEAATPLADVLAKTAIGSAGAFIMKMGIMISVTGATLSWILLVVELPYLAAKDGLMPSWFAGENKRGVAIRSLIVTQILIQICLVCLLSEKLQSTYNTVYYLSTSTMLIPYIFSGLYSCKLWLQNKNVGVGFLIAVIATIYSVFVVYAVGWLYLALTTIIFAIGVFPYYIAKKEKNSSYTIIEKVVSFLFIILGIFLTYQIIIGAIQP